ncbi:MAG: AraC family transcriptional regulator [Microthrixaceae bacterium]
MLLAPSSRFAHDVERRLLQRLDQPYDLGALSREFNVSTRTMLLRRFAAETGRSPLDFLQSARVQAAKRLLETDDMSVAAVMERVGYRRRRDVRPIVHRTGRGLAGGVPAAVRCRRYTVGDPPAVAYWANGMAMSRTGRPRAPRFTSRPENGLTW